MDLYISRERSKADEDTNLPREHLRELQICKEIPWDATITEYMEVFVAFLIGLTFTEEQIMDAFYDYLESHEYLEDVTDAS